jgi:mono/diheme cytochrome c family protein
MRVVRDVVVTLVTVCVVVALVSYLKVADGGLSAATPPTRVERVIAGRLVRLSIPSADRLRPNPFAADANAWHEAADHYADHCATCHGTDGRGHTEVSEHMYPPVPDLTSTAAQQLSDGDLYYIIQNGVRWTGMPAFGSDHSPEETWRLVSFVRHIPGMAAANVH